MKSILKPIIFISLFLILFSSCVRDDASNLMVTQESVALKAGLYDTIDINANFVGDQEKVPVSIKVADSTVAQIQIFTPSKNYVNKDFVFNRSVIIKALKPGTTNVEIKVGSKKSICPVTVTQTSLVFKQSLVVNYGLSIDVCDNSVFIMYLMPESFFVDTASVIVKGDGQFIHLESFCPAKATSLPAGTFSGNTNGGLNTFLPGSLYEEDGKKYPYGTYIETVDEGKSVYTMVKDGKYSLTVAGETYTIEGDLVTKTDEIVHFIYTGPVSVVDKREKPQVVESQFKQGDLYYAGDFYRMGLSNTFFVNLKNTSVDEKGETQIDEMLSLQLNTYDFSTGSIPTGTYRMLTEAQFDSHKLSPFTIVPGNLSLLQGQVFLGGCWYSNANSPSQKRIISGSMDVTYESGNHTINYVFYDRIGSKFSGSYSGKLNYISLRSGAPAKVKAAEGQNNNPEALPVSRIQTAKDFGRFSEIPFRCIKP
jgi:hypothetical protein